MKPKTKTIKIPKGYKYHLTRISKRTIEIEFIKPITNRKI